MFSQKLLKFTLIPFKTNYFKFKSYLKEQKNFEYID